MNLDSNVRKGFTKEVPFQLITNERGGESGETWGHSFELFSKWLIFVSFSSFYFLSIFFGSPFGQFVSVW